MDILMSGVDILVFMVMASMLKLSYAFTKLSLKNREAHVSDAVAQMHYQDHAVAVIFSLIGSTIGTVMSVFHILQQHVLLVDIYWSEIGLCSGFIFLALSGIMFMRHMICEETPGHPYYVREHGLEEDPQVQMDTMRRAAKNPRGRR